jgi:hypothetical protein
MVYDLIAGFEVLTGREVVAAEAFQMATWPWPPSRFVP